MVSPETLRSYRYFTAGGEEALEQIAQFAEEEHLEAGELLFDVGDASDNIYVVIEGQVELSLQLGSGRREGVDTMVAGDLIGWSALAHEPKRRAACQARTEASVVAIDGEKLRALCDRNAEFGYRMMRELFFALGRRLDGAWVQLAALNAE